MVNARRTTLVVLALLLLTPELSVAAGGGGDRRGQPGAQQDLQHIQVAAFRHFVVRPCAVSAPIYSGGCLLSIKRGPVSDYVLDHLRDVAVVGRSEPGDFKTQDAVSVAFAKKRALLLDIWSVRRRGRDLVEVELEIFSSPLGATVCTGMVRRLKSAEWLLVSDDVRCTIS